ncbi:MAG: sporulation peptidase YabG [Bacilli bacterium]|nr:sporulation peptidase YabG [Bacilli bacterium]
MFKVGDKVIVIDDDNKNIYKIKSINELICLVGYSYRMVRYVKEEEIRLATDEELEKEELKNQKRKKLIKEKSNSRKTKAIFGRILHIDGDKEYLNSCMALYKELGIYAEGIHLSEKEGYLKIKDILLQITPDIIVITGHDAYNGSNIASLDSYENSKYFVKTIREIRKHFSLDDVIVIAGACGSHFEALIASGANFASSPKRLNTHTYDPAVAAIKVATTSINQNIDFDGLLKYIENGRSALGGVETKGKMRLLL